MGFSKVKQGTTAFTTQAASQPAPGDMSLKALPAR
jgi:hypothetical protein